MYIYAYVYVYIYIYIYIHRYIYVIYMYMHLRGRYIGWWRRRGNCLSNSLKPFERRYFIQLQKPIHAVLFVAHRIQ